MTNLKKLHTRIEWELFLKTVSAVHIGTDRKPSAAVYPLMNEEEFDDADSFVIPGSSFRGLVRTSILNLEQLASGINIETYANHLFGHGEHGGQRGRLWIGDTTVPKTNMTIKRITPIDRITHQSVVRLKVFSIAPNSDVVVKMVIENPFSYELGFLALFFRSLSEEHLTIGSGGSRGMGRLKLVELDTKVLTTQESELKTEDGITFSLTDWAVERSFLGTEYRKKEIGSKSYQWMQFGATQLKNLLMKGEALS